MKKPPDMIKVSKSYVNQEVKNMLKSKATKIMAINPKIMIVGIDITKKFALGSNY